MTVLAEEKSENVADVKVEKIEIIKEEKKESKWQLVKKTVTQNGQGLQAWCFFFRGTVYTLHLGKNLKNPRIF